MDGGPQRIKDISSKGKSYSTPMVPVIWGGLVTPSCFSAHLSHPDPWSLTMCIPPAFQKYKSKRWDHSFESLLPFPSWRAGNVSPFFPFSPLLSCYTKIHGWHAQEFQVLRVLEPTLRMKAQADSNSRGRKDFICREFSWRKEKNMHSPCILGNAGGPRNRWSRESGWGLGFIAFFCIAWGQRCLSGADRGFLGKSGVSLITYHLLGPPAVRPSVLHSQ
jgi:hypothetical protein